MVIHRRAPAQQQAQQAADAAAAAIQQAQASASEPTWQSIAKRLMPESFEKMILAVVAVVVALSYHHYLTTDTPPNKAATDQAALGIFKGGAKPSEMTPSSVANTPCKVIKAEEIIRGSFSGATCQEFEKAPGYSVKLEFQNRPTVMGTGVTVIDQNTNTLLCQSDATGACMLDHVSFPRTLIINYDGRLKVVNPT